MKNKRQSKRDRKQWLEDFRCRYPTTNKMAKVSDGYLWAPPFEGDKVCVQLTAHWWSDGGQIIFSVFGKDDTAVGIDFKSSDLDELDKKWAEWVAFYERIPETVNMRWFTDRGFYTW